MPVTSAVHSSLDDVSVNLEDIADGNAEGVYEAYDVDAEMQKAFLTSGYEREEDVSTGNVVGKPEHKKRKKERSSGVPECVKTIGIIIISIVCIIAGAYAMLIYTGTDIDILLEQNETENVSDLNYEVPNNLNGPEPQLSENGILIIP